MGSNIIQLAKQALKSPAEKQREALEKQFNIKRVTDTVIAKMYDVVYGSPEPQDPNTKLFEYGDEVYDVLTNHYDRILTIIPGDMKYNNSTSILNAWDFEPQVSEFNKLLGKLSVDLGFSELPSIPQTGIRFYCQEINMTESVSNQYGDNSLSSINNIATQLVGDYAYMSNGNWDTFTSMLENNLKSMLGSYANPIISGASAMKKGLSSVYNMSKNTLNKAGANTQQSESIMHDLFSGYKVDLPKIWKNSTNNKQLTVKLSFFTTIVRDDALKERVLLPYMLLLLLSSPRSSKSYLYKWPFVIKVKLPGYMDVQLAAITDIQVTKGGSNDSKTFTGMYTAIDVSLTITPLYNTQFIVTSGTAPKSMLTVNQELKMINEYFTNSR